MEVMKALYPPEGGKPKGFACNVYVPNAGTRDKVTRTQRGMWAHLRKKHKLKKQTEFEFLPGIQAGVRYEIRQPLSVEQVMQGDGKL